MQGRYPFNAYPGVVRHEHKHGMGGSIAVDPKRAVTALEFGIQAIDLLAIRYHGELEANKKEYDADQQRMHEAHMAELRQMTEAFEKRDKARLKIAEIEKRRSSFFGLSDKDKEELRQAITDFYAHAPYSPGFLSCVRNESRAVKQLRAEVETQLAQCSMALDCAHLTPEWTADIYWMEQDAVAWAEKQSPFNRYSEK